MKRTSSAAIHVWLVLNKAVQAISGYASAEIQRAGLGDSDFRVLEVLLHKGSLPANTIGPKVNLTPGWRYLRAIAERTAPERRRHG
jgi:MarR family transcriptional regulator, 2-MHQ and catechol-resistance regulon repressor